MRVRFWGTRGSLAKPGPSTLRYGGNTPCVEVRTADETLIVLDCGTGAHGLGQALIAENKTSGHLLITHTHWDHIQGFPFFGPLFISGNVWDVHAPYGLGSTLEDTLAGQMEYIYFPVTLDEMGASIQYNDLVEGEFDLGNVHVIARYLNHPAPTLGYRLEVGGVVMVYATDHEPHSHHVHEVTNLPLHHEDLRHIEFLSGADLVVHDSQYTAEEYPDKVGWGHTSIEKAAEFAITAKAKRLALFHHDPLRDDESLDRQVENCRQMVAARNSDLEIFAAAEGQVTELPEMEVKKPRPAKREKVRQASATPAVFQPGQKTVMIADDDPTVVRIILFALRPEGFRLLTAADGEAALQTARAEKPELILMDWDMPKLNGLDVCRALRADADPDVNQVPVVLITAFAEAGDISTAFEAGVTDYVSKPFTPQYVRSRVYAWLHRARRV